jgi:signal transduction histidine kinase
MLTSLLPTEFAPAERLAPDDLQRQVDLLGRNTTLQTFANAMPNIVLVLNATRQTVFANQRLAAALGLESPSAAFGQRPGELFACIHANETPGGCGTTEFCRTCGAANAILSGLAGQAAVQECSITRRPNSEALDLRVYTTPWQVEGEPYTLFAIADISDEKRRRALERIFFHDILNYAGGLRGLVELLKMVKDEKERLDVEEDLSRFSLDLIEEINAQRQLIAAEHDELFLRLEELQSMQILKDLVEIYQGHEVARGKHLKVDAGSDDLLITSDKRLLRRVVGNMVKNALEASRVGEVIGLGCQKVDNQLRFWVQNPRYIPRDFQLQIFNRSFSTKGAGRGLGTYSMRLLGERYLGGKVSFTSDPDSGTTFQILIPL